MKGMDFTSMDFNDICWIYTQQIEGFWLGLPVTTSLVMTGKPGGVDPRFVIIGWIYPPTH